MRAQRLWQSLYDDFHQLGISPKNYACGELFSCLSDQCHWSDLASFVTTLEQTQKAEANIAVIDSDINALIFDYLTTEGYPSAAAKFSKEANLRPQQEEESLIARREIIQSIHSGKIQEAIEALNDLEPQVSLSFVSLSVLAMIRHEFHAPLI